ncbi:MAG: hypothetical protein LBN41_05750 [Enterobacteriaceae bacterium]|jgi:hypothetical protein|nr:hypothetical protein [Enterobacteriaceae bacterium]
MRTDLQVLYRAIQQFIIYSLAVAIAIGMMFMDATFIGCKLEELSFVEITQEIILLFVVILFLRLAYKNLAIRNSSILIAGFFACMFFRELDSVLDLITHGFWVYPALLVTAICLFYTSRDIKKTLNQLANFVRSPNYGFMISGLICTLVLSRLFGMKYLWFTFHPEQSRHLMYNIKAFVEEGTELFGYALCTIASLCYYSEVKGQYNTEQQKIEDQLVKSR